VFASPATDKHFLFITYPGGINALVALVSFGVSGIYLSFLLTVIGALVARSRGWVPEGRFTLGRWGMTVTVIGAAYLALMFVNVVLPTGLSSPRGALFNYDWITLLVIVIIAAVGAIYFFAARPDRGVRHHLHDDLEPSGSERGQPAS
jgi:amino acid transporter